MSAQVPMNMIITAAMLTFYKTPSQVIFWQWFNQSFNAMVNYTNRSGSSPISVNQLGISYLSATSAALVTALGLNKLVKRAPPLIGRFVPFVAVAAANCINIPLMRQKEIKEGIEIYDENGNMIGQSKVAAKKAIREVVFSRIAMASPGMRKCAGKINLNLMMMLLLLLSIIYHLTSLLLLLEPPIFKTKFCRQY